MDLILVDLPLGIIGYFIAVFIIQKFLSVAPSQVMDRQTSSAAESGAPVVVESVVSDPEVTSVPFTVAVAEIEPVVSCCYGCHVPEDSTLRRHFITHVRSLLDDLAGAPPTDSTLNRHFAQTQEWLLDCCLKDETILANLCVDQESACCGDMSEVTIEIPAQAPVQQGEKIVEEAVVSEEDHEDHLPEDASLRRIYLSHIRMMLETVAGVHPSDSTLRRHYEQFIDSGVAECERCSTRLSALIEDYEESKAG